MGIGSGAGLKQKAVFLDRDGVLNEAIIKNGKPYPPSTLEEFVIPQTVLPALQQLKAKGFLLIVVTNQPDIARGTVTEASVLRFNTLLQQQLPIDAIRICPHDDRDDCNCRKPKAGLLLNAASKHQIALDRSYMVGDRWRDVAAGQAAGCKTVWIDYGYDEPSPAKPADYRAMQLTDAINWIIRDTI